MANPQWETPAFRETFPESLTTGSQDTYPEPRLRTKDVGYVKGSKLTALGDRLLRQPEFRHSAPYGRDNEGRGEPLYGPAPVEDYYPGWWPEGVDLDRSWKDDIQVLTAMGFVFGRRLGSGGFGDVYAVRDTNANRDLAAKVLELRTYLFTFEKPLSLRETAAQMLREVDVLRRLRHPNLVAIDSVVHIRDRGSGFRSLFAVIFMELCSGSLYRLMRPRMTEPDAHRWFVPIGDALRYLHGERVAHLDIKPDNILYADRDGRRLYKLADFGLARVFPACRPDTSVRSGEVEGADFYRPPEVRHIKNWFMNISGHPVLVDAMKCDVYSLGVTLAESLIGSHGSLIDVKQFSYVRLRPGLYAKRWVMEELVGGLRYMQNNPVLALLTAMLETDPNARPGIDAVMQHEWVSVETTHL